VKILNTDDNAENLYLIEALFRGHGHEVVSVRNGQEALDAARANRFDVIVSDLLMPRMDGFQLIRELREDPQLSDIPIVIYTATYTDAKDEALVYRLGADRFLIKPADSEDLLRVVEEAIRVRVSGAAPPRAGARQPGDKVSALEEHNARLIVKLEKKMQDLERVNQALQEDIQARKRQEAERNRLEEQLRHAQKMEAIGTLAGGIAHDFNNILTGVLCAAELGMAQVDRPDAVRKLFEDILAAGTRARDLVRQILVFSRQQSVQKLPLNMENTVREALRFLRSTLPAGVDLQTDLSVSLPSVLADPTHIHQIVTNLCTNAWHAIGTGANGVIQVALQAVEVTPEQAQLQAGLCPGRYVCLRVTDKGCGMDATTRARAFEPFFTTKPPGVGSGLGLSVVHGLMRSYDGAIVLETEPGKGSTFRLYFPAMESPTSTTAAIPSDVPRGQGQRVLFVDDEPMLVRLGQSLLEHLGYLALPFTNPNQALETFGQKGAEAVLVDLSMPDCNGLDFARRALAIRPKVPVVLMTGFSADLTLEQVRARGLSGLLPKPYNQESLGRILGKVLSQSAA
jgi:CheY-like chemotaxis protein